jgi:hypothetical protein
MSSARSDPAFQEAVLAALTFVGPLRVLYSDYDPQSFGNAQIGLEGEKLRLRVTRDRSQILIDLSPREVAAEWFDEDVVVELVAGRMAAERLENFERPLHDAAETLRSHWPAILDRFRGAAWSETRLRLRALQEERAKRLFG